MDLTGTILIVVTILWLSDAWIYPQDSQVAADTTRAFSNILRMVIVCLTAVVFLSEGARPLWRFASGNKNFIIILVYCVLSAFYFSVPGASGFIFNLVVVWLFSAYLQENYDYISVVSVFFYALSGIVLASLFFVVFMQDWGLMAGLHQGSFRGAFAHKNNLGIFLLSYMALLLAHFRLIVAPALIKVGMALIAGFLLVGCKSATSLSLIVMFIVILTSLTLIQAVARGQTLRIVLIFVLIGLALFFAGSIIPAVLEVFGRNATLTGRSAVWSFFMARVEQAPLFGHGAFSLYSDNELIHIAGQVLFYGARSSHNSYIDIMYNIGYVGLGAYIAFALVVMWSSVRDFVRGNVRVVQFRLAFSIVFFAYGFVESYQSGLNAGLPLFLVMCLSHRAFRRLPSSSYSLEPTIVHGGASDDRFTRYS